MIFPLFTVLFPTLKKSDRNLEAPNVITLSEEI